MIKDPYQTLLLPPTASTQAIKQRYRHLSKLVHPDKHPIQNYQIAQQKFKQIDQAYKSISTELRRYVYKHYGYTGIQVVEGNPYLFGEFEGMDFNHIQKLEKLNKVIMYCLYEQHAANEIDKSKLRAKSSMMVYKPLNDINQLPSMDRSEFSFQTSLPDFLGMTHTASITNSSEGLNSQTKSSMIYGLSSSKRITQAIMMNMQAHASDDKFNLELGLDRAINNNLILHFIPINMQNGELGPLQVGADYHRDNYYISGITDGNVWNFHIGSSPNDKKVTKSVKFGFDGNNFMIAPVYERDVLERLRLFVQLQIRVEKGGNALNLTTGIAYGYRIKILDQLKLQLASYIGGPHSNFQVNILTPKFKANIPIFSRADFITFQLYKLGAFACTFLCFELYRYLVKRTNRVRKRLQFQNYNRLTVQKNVVAKVNSEVDGIAADSKQKEMKNDGLVILLGYIGSQSSVNSVHSRVIKQLNLTHPKKHTSLAETLEKCSQLQQQIKTNNDEFSAQLHELTQSLQAKVRGSQLLNFNAQQEVNVNPCIDQKQPYRIIVVYYLRGQIGVTVNSGDRTVTIGGVKNRYYNLWNRAISYITTHIVN